ncbi:hypothetical protein HNR65_002957 [Desulfosalsimonas propionicica]|uniref:Lipoprotein n=1 Tax=Desulfosalsimonas propionicica TaxID=332175 RepID=A0A7W0HLT0_9BACT|nr:hypothetical protein [Desulfosalsimonas propionicica]MBA2882603.1 hypothetical protein [Desulfosalsimonas propionicica]
MMKHWIYSGFLVLMAAALISCAAGLTRDGIDPWLADISGDRAPAINVEGKWQDADVDPNTPFGWGKGVLEQTNGRIEGHIGHYNVTGRVSGNEVYLVFLSGGSVYYTARLEMKEKGLLRGDYFYDDDLEQESGMPMSLEKVE